MNQDKLHNIRHSLSHIMSMAVTELYPNAGLGVGPVIEDGFYQDYDLPTGISEEIFAKLESRMREIIKQKIDFVQHEMDFAPALELYKNDPYKTELITDLKAVGEKNVSFYKSGNFDNLCLGPHVINTSEINPDAFKLTKVAGAYWRGDEKNKMLTRIYGVAFETKEDLDNYLHMMEEAEKRDHRKLGKELDLFMMHDYAQGIPFFLPKGMVILQELLKFVREFSYGSGYKEIRTPQILNSELWKTSGHWGHYQENMFCLHHEEDNVDLAVKPMNCPAHMLMFERETRSYRDLPLRLAETTTLYRNERSGALHGLTRVRSISQDDTHIFLTEEQVLGEIGVLLEKIKKIYEIFGLKIDQIDLSTRPKEFMGEIEVWNNAESNLRQALEDKKMAFEINEGDGAFYGPKIDVKVKDVIGRQWQLATIQLDFQMPSRFGLHYIDSEGKEKTPVVIHRAILGSIERFMGVIIEQYAGAFPLWLSPVQIHLVPVSSKHVERAKELALEIEKNDIRVSVDSADETVGNKVRKAVGQKVPYIVVVGDKELGGEPWTIRVRGQEEQIKMSKEEFLLKVKEEIKEKK